MLVDIQLPGMNGLELTRRIKQDSRTRDIVVVRSTACAMKGDDERGLSSRLRRLHHQTHRNSHAGQQGSRVSG